MLIGKKISNVIQILRIKNYSDSLLETKKNPMHYERFYSTRASSFEAIKVYVDLLGVWLNHI